MSAGSNEMRSRSAAGSGPHDIGSVGRWRHGQRNRGHGTGIRSGRYLGGNDVCQRLEAQLWSR